MKRTHFLTFSHRRAVDSTLLRIVLGGGDAAFSKLQWSNTVDKFELIDKVSQIVEPTFKAQRGDGDVGGFQQQSRLLNSVGVDVRRGRFAQMLFEESAEVLLVHVGDPGQL